MPNILNSEKLFGSIITGSGICFLWLLVILPALKQVNLDRNGDPLSLYRPGVVIDTPSPFPPADNAADSCEVANTMAPPPHLHPKQSPAG